MSAGGVALNCVSNASYFVLVIFDDIYSTAAGDAEERLELQ